MLKEYTTNSLACPDLGNPDHWDVPITINLKHVIAAEPTDTRPIDMRFTAVTMVSGPRRIAVDVEYSRFLRDWHSVKQ